MESSIKLELSLLEVDDIIIALRYYTSDSDFDDDVRQRMLELRSKLLFEAKKEFKKNCRSSDSELLRKLGYQKPIKLKYKDLEELE